MLIETLGQVRGYCADKIGVPLLRAVGIPERLIYCEGRGAETIGACIASLRDRPGAIVVAAILDRPMQRGGIAIVGFSARQFEELTDLLDALSEASALRRLCAIL